VQSIFSGSELNVSTYFAESVLFHAFPFAEDGNLIETKETETWQQLDQ
jgi:hypothetical protein